MKVVYIAGRFRGMNAYAVHKNCNAAEDMAYKVWSAGLVALCPHNNTRHFDGCLTDAVWLTGDLELLKRCDAMILVDGWKQSNGALAERDFALACGLPVFEHFVDLIAWHTTSPAKA